MAEAETPKIWTVFFVPENTARQKRSLSNLDSDFCLKIHYSFLQKKGIHQISTEIFGSENSYQGSIGPLGGQNISRGARAPLPPPTSYTYGRSGKIA